jgi:uncharacterized protein
MLNYFNFKRMEDNRIFITNDFGCYEFLNRDEFQMLANNRVEKESNLYQRLHKKLFMIEPMEIYSREVVDNLRRIKNYVFGSTSLHILVVTNQCNLKCIYCQAQDHMKEVKGMMSEEIGKKAVDIALQAPGHRLTLEFQGGEPLINFSVVKAVIKYAEEHKGDKIVNYTLISNFSLLTDAIADFLLEHKVGICTSLDGSEYVHTKNRLCMNGSNSYRLMQQGIEKLRKRGFQPGAIQTTTRYSLPKAREIVREYLQMGMQGIFLRPLTPLGFAKSDWEKIGYTADEFLTFYREAFDEVLKINKEGTRFVEQHAVFFLRKILTGNADNYMELRSPCGATLGQMAYYYNGDIYTCDEARMVAEGGDKAFRLGSVFDSDYRQLVSGRTCKATCAASILETIPGCCDCVYQPYCGVCPVINYASYGNIFPKQIGGYRCEVYRGIVEFLFRLLDARDKATIEILNSWVRDDQFENIEP